MINRRRMKRWVALETTWLLLLQKKCLQTKRSFALIIMAFLRFSKIFALSEKIVNNI